MSEKAKFIASQQTEAEQRAAAEKKAAEDIAAFQEASLQLAKDLKSWVEGTPITAETRQVTVRDETVRKEYAATETTLRFNDKRLVFRPNALYLLGGMGLVEIGGLKYDAHLTRINGTYPWQWTLTVKQAPKNQQQPARFDEEALFSLLNNHLK
ncbi:hypothetical protein CURE108131_25255 [Cupriavidus respiraculi]|uniref:Uncharacterized protein n=1 Tax=Cupriavidus respiraculi TaxID=195930 RepID=A0ABM8XVH3_9BURK|nr:hypothetical protein [Cupriavidus respiraculi]CAG9184374.1 hypothetical protein LMG21510_05082 [Cupriavidus respiraculi]